MNDLQGKVPVEEQKSITSHKPNHNLTCKSLPRYSIDCRDDLGEGSSKLMSNSFKRDLSKVMLCSLSQNFSIESFQSTDTSFSASTIQSSKSMYTNDKILLDFSSLEKKCGSSSTEESNVSTEESSKLHSGTQSYGKVMASANQLNTAATIYAEEAWRILGSILHPKGLNEEKNSTHSKNTEYWKETTDQTFQLADESPALMKMSREKVKDHKSKNNQSGQIFTKHHPSQELLKSDVYLHKNIEDNNPFDRSFSDDPIELFLKTTTSTLSSKKKRIQHSWINSFERFMRSPTQTIEGYDNICGCCDNDEDDQKFDPSSTRPSKDPVLGSDKSNRRLSQINRSSLRKVSPIVSNQGPKTQGKSWMAPLENYPSSNRIEAFEENDLDSQFYEKSSDLSPIMKKRKDKSIISTMEKQNIKIKNWESDKQDEIKSTEEAIIECLKIKGNTQKRQLRDDSKNSEKETGSEAISLSNDKDELSEQISIRKNISNNRLDNQTTSINNERNSSENIRSIESNEHLASDQNNEVFKSQTSFDDANISSTVSKSSNGKLGFIKNMMKKGKELRGKKKKDRTTVVLISDEKEDKESKNKNKGTQLEDSNRNHADNGSTQHLKLQGVVKLDDSTLQGDPPHANEHSNECNSLGSDKTIGSPQSESIKTEIINSSGGSEFLLCNDQLNKKMNHLPVAGNSNATKSSDVSKVTTCPEVDTGTERYLISPAPFSFGEQNNSYETNNPDREDRLLKSESSCDDFEGDRYKIYRHESPNLLLKSTFSENGDKYSQNCQQRTKKIYSLSMNSAYGNTNRTINSVGDDGRLSPSKGRKFMSLSKKINNDHLTNSLTDDIDRQYSIVSPPSEFTGVSSFVQTEKWNGYKVY